MLFSLAAIGSICIAANLFVSAAPPASFSIGPRVRGATAAVNAVLASGVKRSPTFARLVREIDETDLIVYVAKLPASICLNEVVISPTWNRGYAALAGLGPKIA